MIHSDQGSRYTSKEFTEYCEGLGITQSMSKAGYPYDNAPMERYFNTLKNDLIYQHYYHTEEGSHHNIPYYKTSRGNVMTRRYTMNGDEVDGDGKVIKRTKALYF